MIPRLNRWLARHAPLPYRLGHVYGLIAAAVVAVGYGVWEVVR